MADGARDGEHVAQVGRAVLIWRGADGDDLEQAVLHALRRIRGEFEAPGVGIALDERIEPGLVDGHLALVQALDLAGVDIDADDVIARLGEAGARDEAHVAGAEDGDSH